MDTEEVLNGHGSSLRSVLLRRLHYESCGWSVLESFFRSFDNRVINPERTASTKNTKTILNNEIDKLFDMDK